MNADERLDLSPLDPENDPERLERVVDGVMHRLGPGLVPSPPPLSSRVVEQLASRFRPLFAAASIVAVVAAAALGTPRPAEVDPSPELAVSIPLEWSVWMLTESTPRAEDLLITFAGGGP
ncbi:MAG: hypothetical protein AAF389_02450 [Gemmatimonadota bacterium]